MKIQKTPPFMGQRIRNDERKRLHCEWVQQIPPVDYVVLSTACTPTKPVFKQKGNH